MLILTTLLLNIFYHLAQTTETSLPFPGPYNPVGSDNRNLHIVAESVSHTNGYQTIEEFVDFELGKLAHIVLDDISQDSQVVTHVDYDSIYRYKSYSCETDLKPEDLIGGNESHLWLSSMNLKAGALGERSQFRLFGIVALWLNAHNMDKLYSPDSPIYGASNNVLHSADKYTLDDDKASILINFYFTRLNTSRGLELHLEMIQIVDKHSSEILQTINILLIEHKLPDGSRESLLELPLGYGCFGGEHGEREMLTGSHIGVLLAKSHKIELEATAVKFNMFRLNGNEQTSASDTISLQLISSSFDDSLGPHKIQSIRRRDSAADVKTIYNYQFHVQYQLDMRRGLCRMANMAADRSSSAAEAIAVTFKNGLKLEMDREKMEALFSDVQGFRFVKRTSKSVSRDLVYFEKEIEEHTGDGRTSIKRIVRAYSVVSRSSPSWSEKASGEEIRLESVTILMFDRKHVDLHSSFSLNILEAVELSEELEIAKLLDVSDYCYLNNEDKRQGKDFAWFELSYPVELKFRELLLNRAQILKEQLYGLIVHSQLGLFRAPKMELMFTDEGFTVRVLLLELPPLEVMFDSREKTRLRADKSNLSADLEGLASDLEHCSELCKLYKCKTMSFCDSSHACSLTMESLQTITIANTASQLVETRLLLEGQEGCTTFSLPEDEVVIYDSLYELTLERLLSKLQHQEYRQIELPKVPDELSVPEEESDLNGEERDKMAKRYLNQLYKFIQEHEQEGIPTQIFLANMDGVMLPLAPNRFSLDQDPIREFQLRDQPAGLHEDQLLEQDGVALRSFRQGLSMLHYKMSLLSEGAERSARLFNGLNYDKCALACLDNRCSSFSYCTLRQECIITDIYELGSSLANSSIEQDLDCFIVQRDFLSKFTPFEKLRKPDKFNKMVPSAYNPSECAHSCILERDFNCKAFDFCTSDNPRESLATCYYLDSDEIGEDLSDLKGGQCTHYARSHLADFTRIPHRKLRQELLGRTKTSTLVGRSVDQCAEICINEFENCSGFQFCLDPLAEGAMQSCLMLEGKLAPEDNSSSQIILADYSNLNEFVQYTGKLFLESDECHLFSLRPDSTQARFRDLALNRMTAVSTPNERLNTFASQEKGLTIGGGILLYLCVALSSAAVGCGVCIARYKCLVVRRNLERFESLIGFG